VTGLYHRCGKAISARLIQQVILDCGFLNPVVPNGVAWCFFGGRNLDTVPQDPDRPAMQEMLHPLTQTANELLRAFKSETDEVNYDVGFQLEDAPTEQLGGVLSRPVRSHLLY
jgi:hypothetical protein